MEEIKTEIGKAGNLIKARCLCTSKKSNEKDGKNISVFSQWQRPAVYSITGFLYVLIMKKGIRDVVATK